MDIVLVGRALGQIGLVLVREVGPCGACGDLGRASLGRKDEKVEKVKQNVKVVICCPNDVFYNGLLVFWLEKYSFAW